MKYLNMEENIPQKFNFNRGRPTKHAFSSHRKLKYELQADLETHYRMHKSISLYPNISQMDIVPSSLP